MRRLFVLTVLATVLTVIPVVPGLATDGTMYISADTDLAGHHNGNIVITADGVTLDCAGYSITGGGTGVGISIFGLTGVTVENCHVSEFDIGINVFDSSDTNIRGNTAEGGDQGFQLWFSNDNTLVGNTATNTNSEGFVIGESTGNTLTLNVARDNVHIGFHLGRSSQNDLISNHAEDNGWADYDLYLSDDNRLEGNSSLGTSHGFGLGESNDNTLAENTATNNDQGFGIGFSSGNTLVGNTATNNSSVGFALYGSSENILSGNSASGNWPSEEPFTGFLLADGSTNNTLEYNSADGYIDGFHLNRSSDNTLALNEAFENNSGFVFRGAFDNQVKDNTAWNNNAGFYIASQVEEGGTAFPSYGNTFESNTANSNTYDGFVIREASFENTLTQNQVSDNGTGFSLTGGSFDNLLTENTAVDSIWVGFMVSEWSYGNRLEHNTQIGPSNNGYQLSDASGNVFDSNVSLGAWDTGFALIAADNNTLVNNTVDGYEDGYEPDGLPAPHVGFSLYFSSDGNTLSQNATVGNTEAGYLIVESNNNHLIQNVSKRGAASGFIVESGGGNELIKNRAILNLLYGFEDRTSGGQGDAGTDNFYTNNVCAANGSGGSIPAGICPQGSHPNSRSSVGFQLSLLGEGSIEAGAAFHVRHGWAIDAVEFSPPSSFFFRLEIDDAPVAGWKNIVMGGCSFPALDDCMSRTTLYNFADGLTAGNYVFVGRWFAACGWAVANDLYGGPCPEAQLPVEVFTAERDVLVTEP